MPLRSVMMKRFIFGFQRRVWCPKWTPLSRSWRMVTTAMPCPGPFPPIRRTEQVDPWGTVGQQRRIVFVGPGDVRETLVAVTRPHSFGYELTDPSGPLALLIATVNGRWDFDPAPLGVRVTWSWQVHARNRAARAFLPLVAFFWRGYARAGLARLELLLRP
jgi:hypothetical protein